MKKHIILLIVSLASFTGLFAQYDNADAIYDKITREYTLNKDGSTVFREFKRLKLLSHASFNRFYGETFIVYNPQYQDLTIHESYTIMSDGKKVVAPPNSFNEVLPRNAANSATFNHLREMVVTHIATEIGATLFLDYSLTTKKGYWPALMGNELICESSPIRHMEIRVSVPQGAKLNFKLFNSSAKPEMLSKGGEQKYVWKFENIPASSKEPFLGRALSFLPRLVFSTAKDIQSQQRWVVQQPAFEMQLSEPMRRKVEKILAEQPDEMKQVLAIQKEVAQQLVYDRVEPIYVGFKARTPADVIASNGGTQLEKAILLAAMLRHARFNAIPVLVGPGVLFDSKSSNLLQFDEVAVMVQTKNTGVVYFSAVSIEKQSLDLKYSEVVLLPLSREKNPAPIMLSAAYGNIAVSGKLVLDANMKLTGTFQTEIAGAANPFLSLMESNKGAAAILTGSIVAKGDESVTVSECTKSKSSINYLLEKENITKANNGFCRWELPLVNSGFESWNIGFLASSRIDPITIPFTLSEKYEYTVDFPDGYSIVTPKTQVNLSCESGYVNISIQPTGRQLSIKREISIDKTIIATDDYPAFRDMINAWLDRNNRTVVFGKQL